MVRATATVALVAAVVATCAFAAPYESITYNALVRRKEDRKKELNAAANEERTREQDVEKAKAAKAKADREVNAAKTALNNGELGRAESLEAKAKGNRQAAGTDMQGARTAGKQERHDLARADGKKRRSFDELEARELDDYQLESRELHDYDLDARDFDELAERGFDDYDLDMMD